jgi:hypothetical protein
METVVEGNRQPRATGSSCDEYAHHHLGEHMPKVFGREPAAWIALFAVLLQLLSSYLIHWGADVQGVVNAVIVALFGLWTATHLPDWRDKILPALLGLAQAVFALVLAFGDNVSQTTQSQWMALITVLVGLFVRTQVTAPVQSPQPSPVQPVQS